MADYLSILDNYVCVHIVYVFFHKIHKIFLILVKCLLIMSETDVSIHLSMSTCVSVWKRERENMSELAVNTWLCCLSLHKWVFVILKAVLNPPWQMSYKTCLYTQTNLTSNFKGHIIYFSYHILLQYLFRKNNTDSWLEIRNKQWTVAL